MHKFKSVLWALNTAKMQGHVGAMIFLDPCKVAEQFRNVSLNQNLNFRDLPSRKQMASPEMRLREDKMWKSENQEAVRRF